MMHCGGPGVQLEPAVAHPVSAAAVNPSSLEKAVAKLTEQVAHLTVMVTNQKGA